MSSNGCASCGKASGSENGTRWPQTRTEAASGTEALRIAAHQQVDVALIDIGLPDIDGYAVAARLRALASTRALPLIALTGYDQEKDRQRAMLSGFDEHLREPVGADALIELITKLLSRRGFGVL